MEEPSEGTRSPARPACAGARRASRAAAAAPHHHRYRAVGDALHLVALACVAAYALAVSRLPRESRASGDGDGDDGREDAPAARRRASSWFDREWTDRGFCMPHDDAPFRSTHERSAFVLIALSVLGALLVRSLDASSSSPVMQRARRRVKWALFGAVGHACGHLILAVNGRNGLLPDGSVSAVDEFRSDEADWTTFAKHVPGYFLFYMPLVKTYMYNVSNDHVATYAFLVMAGAMQLPLKFGFSYTLAVLFAGQSIDQLLVLRGSEKGGIDYALWPAATLLPNFCISVLESALCTRSEAFRALGHVIFDGYMASSYCLYYLGCWLWNKQGDAKAKGKQKRV